VFCKEFLNIPVVSSERSDQDVCGGGSIKADCAAIDPDHAAPTATLAKQFQFASWQDPQVGHLGAGFPVAIDGANPNSAMAAGFGQWAHPLVPVAARDWPLA
jgi:hypothetical protein